MTEVMVPKQIVEELRAIREDLDYIKEHMVDADTILSPEEKIRLKESLDEYNAGKAVPLEDFEKEMKK